MINNIELVLKNVGNLDIDNRLNEKFGIELTYNISDIENVGSKKSNFSKSFTLIGTPNNNKHLQFCFDVNLYSLTFDLNKRQRCILLLNKNIMMDGYLKIRSIKKTYIDGNYQILYEVNIYDEIKNIFTSLGEKKLTDLDFSQPFMFKNVNYSTGNHIFNKTRILGSMNRTKTYTNIYEYCLVNYNYNGKDYGQRYPNADLTLSQFYPSVYVKAIVDKMFLDIGYSYKSDFFDGITDDGMYLNLATIYNKSKMLTKTEFFDGYYNSNIYAGTVDGEKIIDIPILKSYQSDEVLVNKYLLIRGDGKFNFIISFFQDGNHVDDTEFIIYKNDYDEIYSEQIPPNSNLAINITEDLKAGDVVKLAIKYKNTNDLVNITGSIDINVVNDGLDDKLNKTLNIGDFLPDMTQADFLKSLINQFNLYVYIDKDNENILYIDPRNTFLAKGKILDWNKKFNTTEVLIEPTNTKLKRYYNFKMTKIDTYWGNDYFNKWNSNYGCKEIDLNNEDLSGTENIETKFAAYDYTYIDGTSDYLFIPNLIKDEKDSIATAKRELAPMIGLIKSHISTPYSYKFFGSGTVYTKWNCINHVENFGLYDTYYDINFETKQGMPANTINSFDNYWKRPMNNIFDINNRLITYYVKLNIDDIINLDFKNAINLDNNFYYLQSLTVDITSDDLVAKVVLLKAIDYEKNITEVNLPLIYGFYGVGTVGSGTNRPIPSQGLLDNGKKVYIDTEDDIIIASRLINNVHIDINLILWFAIPNESIYCMKNTWEVNNNQYNKGEIGGGENLYENLFPDPISVDYYGKEYLVYVANYQTYIDINDFLTLKY